MASAAWSASAAAAFRRGSSCGPCISRGEGGEFLFELRRAAFRALGALPIAGTDQNLAVFAALFAVKLVDWHERRVMRGCEISRRN